MLETRAPAGTEAGLTVETRTIMDSTTRDDLLARLAELASHLDAAAHSAQRIEHTLRGEAACYAATISTATHDLQRRVRVLRALIAKGPIRRSEAAAGADEIDARSRSTR
ncbi:MAG: hypothetical protein GWO02_16360 [Gammaproteobacteria bacterium]|nr:hypothetical protein [Gammaproteobacteria bacterium]